LYYITRAEVQMTGEPPEHTPPPTGPVRIPTGIRGLDDVIDGFPRGGAALLIGEAGSGKTAFAIQFADSTCARGLRTAFLSTRQKAQHLRLQARSAGRDLEAHERRGLLAIVEVSEVRASRVELSAARGIGPMRTNFTEMLNYLPAGLEVLIMDSLCDYASDLSPGEFRDALTYFVQNLNHRGITSLLLLDSSAPDNCKDLALLSVQGVVQLFRWDNPHTGQRERVMDIVKMGNARTPVHLMRYELCSGGIEVRALDEMPRTVGQ